MTALTIILALATVLFYLGIVYQLVMGNRPASSKLFWILFLLFVPVVGLLAYLVFGLNYQNAKVRESLHAKTLERFRRDLPPEMVQRLFSNQAEEELDAAYKPLARLLRGAGKGNKVYAGNSFEIITSGHRKRELILADLRKASRYIHVEYYKFGNDSSGREVRQVLMEKAAQGVQVRFLYNSMTMFRYPRSYFGEMRRAGIELIPFTHIRHGFRSWLMHLNHQNHRKIVIVDGEVAYTGGMNLNDNYFYKWRDTHLRLHGPVIARLQASFIDHWLSFGGRISHPLPYYFEGAFDQLPEDPFKDQLLQVVTDAPENAFPATQMGYEWILQHASRYVYIQTPYFAPPEPLLNAIKAAALRGVEVRLMFPDKIDAPFIGPMSQALFEECLEAGVRIFLHSGVFIHAKTLVADDALSIVGASNLDHRSFSINAEVNTFVYGAEMAQACKDIFMKDLTESQEISLESWLAGRKWYQNLWSRFLLMFQYQF